MVKKLSVAHRKTRISRGAISGVIIGGFVGILIALFLRTNTLITPTLLGIIIGGLTGGILTLYSIKNIDNAEYVPEASSPKQSSRKNVTLQIKEEELDLAKEWMQTGEVKIYKESFTQEKSFTVPVKYEELVIEKTLLQLPQNTKMGPQKLFVYSLVKNRLNLQNKGLL